MTSAAVLLLLLPLVGVVGLVLGLISATIAQDNGVRLADELAGQGFADAHAMMGSVVSSTRQQLGATALFRLVPAAGLGILALFVLRGHPLARTLVCLIGGLVAVGGVCFGILEAGRLSLGSSLADLGPDAAVTAAYGSDVLPGWYRPVDSIMVATSVLVILMVLWLLTRPAAIAFFPPHAPHPPTPLPAALVPGPPPVPQATPPVSIVEAPSSPPERSPVASGAPLSFPSQPASLPQAPPGVPSLPPSRRIAGRVFAGGVAVIVLLLGAALTIALVLRSAGGAESSQFGSMEGLCGRIDPSPADSLAVPLGLDEGDSETSSSRATCAFEAFDAETGGATATLTITASVLDDPDHRQAVFEVSAQGTPSLPELAERWDDSAIYTFPPDSQERGVILTVMDGPLVLAVYSHVRSDGAHIEGPSTADLVEIAEDVRDLIRP